MNNMNNIKNLPRTKGLSGHVEIGYHYGDIEFNIKYHQHIPPEKGLLQPIIPLNQGALFFGTHLPLYIYPFGKKERWKTPYLAAKCAEHDLAEMIKDRNYVPMHYRGV